jgi:hypothetical protein
MNCCNLISLCLCLSFLMMDHIGSYYMLIHIKFLFLLYEMFIVIMCLLVLLSENSYLSYVDGYSGPYF